MGDLATTLTATEADRLVQAEVLVRAYCGWHISPSRTDTVTVRGTGGNVLLLPTMRLTAVVTVTDDGYSVPAADFDVDSNGYLVRFDGYWSYRLVVVQFTHGYTPPPADVTAVVQAVGKRALNNPGTLTRHQVGPFSDSYSLTGANESSTTALLESEKRTLMPYKLPGVA